ncbi:hypothetical protein [Methylomonas sp. HYX-M1]|uniref:hypothetical protein n=1 Tax=Methylomonas sp. HYX-M1 TaxID=3139307 RepID=UPI00345B98B3
MRNMIIISMLILSGCSTVPFTIKREPASATKQQTQLDNLECNAISRTEGPWLFGIGTIIYREVAASSYEECMTKRGYVVERGESNETSKEVVFNEVMECKVDTDCTAPKLCRSKPGGGTECR